MHVHVRRDIFRNRNDATTHIAKQSNEGQLQYDGRPACHANIAESR